MASPFACAKDTLPIPFDPPNTVTIRQLNGRQLERANKAFFNTLVADLMARGGAKVQAEVKQMFSDPGKTPEDDDDVKAVQADPLNGYDKHQLCYDGIVEWSYDKSLDRESVEELNAAGQKVIVMRVKAIDDLSDEALRFFATEVLKLTKPELFQTPEEASAAQKETEADSSVA